MARFSLLARRLFQCFDADKISDAQSSPIRDTTAIMLISDTPIVANMLTTEVVVLKVLVAIVLTRDDIMCNFSSLFDSVLFSFK